MQTPKHNNASLALFGLMVLLVCNGCGGSEAPKLSDYLEELEINTPLEALKEVSLGRYNISAAALAHEEASNTESRTWVQARCELYVVVAPGDEKALMVAHERHQGMFDDMVVQILRSASLDELTDPRWAMIKSRISDAARSLLGEQRIRHVVVNEYGWEPI